MLSFPLHSFRPRLIDALRGYDRRAFVADVGAGASVGIVALPLAMAFAIASGVPPEAGLASAVVAGLLISALGGSSVQIGGPAGAFIVIVYGIVQRYGLANLLISTMLAGVLLFVLGLLRLGVLVRYIPVSIVVGFTNGIAVLVALSQVRDLLGLQLATMPADSFSQLVAYSGSLPTVNPHALGIGLLCVFGLVAWSRIATARRFVAWLPGPIVALATLGAATALLKLPVDTIGSRFGGVPASLPAFSVPALSWQTVQHLVIPTITIALLGAIESLLCARIADQVLHDRPGDAPPRHDPNQELMAQGVANVVTPLFGGLPATGTIARTVTNVKAGARTPVAGIVHAITVLGLVLVAAPLAAHVPLAAMAGILLYVAWNMGDWRAFTRLRQYALGYRVILIGSFALTVVFDLTVAVEVGIVLACVFFVYRMGTLFTVRAVEAPAAASGFDGPVQAFELSGALFFGAVGRIEAIPARLGAATGTVWLDMDRLIWLDSSGLDALTQLHRGLCRQGVGLVLANLRDEPLALIRRTGFEAALGPGCVLAASPSVEDGRASPHMAEPTPGAEPGMRVR